MKAVPSAGKHATVRTAQCQTRERCNWCQAREQMQAAKRTSGAKRGKNVTGAMRGNRCKRCQARENMQVSELHTAKRGKDVTGAKRGNRCNIKSSATIASSKLAGKQPIFYGSWNKKRVSKVGHLLNQNNKFPSFLMYYGLLAAIPEAWKILISNPKQNLTDVFGDLSHLLK